MVASKNKMMIPLTRRHCFWRAKITLHYYGAPRL